jgi:hypothetical protein
MIGKISMKKEQETKTRSKAENKPNAKTKSKAENKPKMNQKEPKEPG